MTSLDHEDFKKVGYMDLEKKKGHQDLCNFVPTWRMSLVFLMVIKKLGVTKVHIYEHYYSSKETNFVEH